MRRSTMAWPLFFSILLSASLSAEDNIDKDSPSVATAKERLVSKAADPQRLNDCKVPIEQRDPNHPRPDDCQSMLDAQTPQEEAQQQ